jgi:predicted patatin/cPLA2 family phospholipase
MGMERLQQKENVELSIEGDAAKVFQTLANSPDAERQDESVRAKEGTEELTPVPLLISGGGGWAGVRGLAMLERFKEHNLLQKFDTVVGVSIGANTAAYALADLKSEKKPGEPNQIKRALQFFIRKAVSHRSLAYISNLWTLKGYAVNTNFLGELVAGTLRKGMQGEHPGQPVAERLAWGERRPLEKAPGERKTHHTFLELDTAALKKAGPTLYAAVTDAKTGEGELVNVTHSEEPIIPLSATIALSGSYPGEVMVEGKARVDGGLACTNLPVRKAIEKMRSEGKKPSVIVAMLSMPTQPGDAFKNWAIGKGVEHYNSPAVLEAYKMSHARALEEYKYLKSLEAQGLPVLILQPANDDLSIIEKNMRKTHTAFNNTRATVDALIAKHMPRTAA